MLDKEIERAGARVASAFQVRRQMPHRDLFLDETMRTDAVRGRLEALGRRRTALKERLARAEAIVASQSAQEAQQEAIERRSSAA
jgi:hypothetical protein